MSSTTQPTSLMSSEKEKMLRGELYHAWVPELHKERIRCHHACGRFNASGEVSRRRIVELWRDITYDPTPLPPQAEDPDADTNLFQDDPYIEPPIFCDYGWNVKMGKGVYVNFNSTFVDTCQITIGARTLVGPNVSFFAATHPLDPALRNGMAGPESGKEIIVEEDCWIGGNAILLPGVRIGRGSTVGAGAVVSKDVPPFHVVAGNPARIIRKIKTSMDPDQKEEQVAEIADAEEPMATMAKRLETQEDQL